MMAEGAGIGIEKGLVDYDESCFCKFSLTLPDPTFARKEEGYLDGVFEFLPVINEVVFLADRGSCC